MVTANSVKFSSVSCKISPSTTGEPSRSTFDSQSLLFGLRSRQDWGNTIIAFVLHSVGTIWAAKHHTKVHHYAKTSRWPSNPSPNTYMICFDACPPVREITWRAWRYFWKGSIARHSQLRDCLCKAHARQGGKFVWRMEEYVFLWHLPSPSNLNQLFCNLHELWIDFSACLERPLLKRQTTVALFDLGSRTYARVEPVNLSRI